MYQHLARVLAKTPSAVDTLQEMLAGRKWVWVGSTQFVSADRVAFKSPANVSPYLFSVPSHLAVFSGLLLGELLMPHTQSREGIEVIRALRVHDPRGCTASSSVCVCTVVRPSVPQLHLCTTLCLRWCICGAALGVRDTFGPSDFVGVLLTMARETHALPGATTGGAPAVATRLTDAQLELAVAMVQKLSDSVIQAADWDVFVPDDGGVLAPSTSLVFDDAPWIIGSGGEAQTGGVGVSGDLRFVHPKISNNVAQLVGVGSLRRKLLATSSEMLSFTGPAEAFGQSESLTRRLRHILELYVSNVLFACL